MINKEYKSLFESFVEHVQKKSVIDEMSNMMTALREDFLGMIKHQRSLKESDSFNTKAEAEDLINKFLPFIDDLLKVLKSAEKNNNYNAVIRTFYKQISSDYFRGRLLGIMMLYFVGLKYKYKLKPKYEEPTDTTLYYSYSNRELITKIDNVELVNEDNLPEYFQMFPDSIRGIICYRMTVEKYRDTTFDKAELANFNFYRMNVCPFEVNVTIYTGQEDDKISLSLSNVGQYSTIKGDKGVASTYRLEDILHSSISDFILGRINSDEELAKRFKIFKENFEKRLQDKNKNDMNK